MFQVSFGNDHAVGLCSLNLVISETIDRSCAPSIGKNCICHMNLGCSECRSAAVIVQRTFFSGLSNNKGSIVNKDNPYTKMSSIFEVIHFHDHIKSSC